MIFGFLKSRLLSFLVLSIALRFLRQLIIIILEISKKPIQAGSGRNQKVYPRFTRPLGNSLLLKNQENN